MDRKFAFRYIVCAIFCVWMYYQSAPTWAITMVWAIFTQIEIRERKL